MKTLEESSKKIKDICDKLKAEAIEPAKKEADAILESAQLKAQQIIEEAERQAKKTLADAKAAIEQERNVFQSFMAQTAKQTVESLRQQIEKRFFKDELYQLVDKQTADPKLLAKVIDVIINAIKKDGLSADFSAIISKQIPVKEVNAFLGENALSQLREKSVVLGDVQGGVQVKLHDKKLMIDLSDDALIDLLNTYRKGFRELLFQR
jgi:V/A-type H+/Na+-transporting ATPase subunit E